MNQMEEGLKEAFDKEIICAGCGDTFIFSVREQSFYASKNFSDPKRCKNCREKRKAEKEAKKS